MKKVLLASIAIGFHCFVSAQNVGIGTKDPIAKLQIVGGTDASVASHGFILLGVPTAQNLVLDNNEILARDNGQVATLFLGRDGSMVQIGNSTLTPGTKLYITSGADLDLTDEHSGFLVLGSIGSGNIVMDNNEIQSRDDGAPSNLYINANGGNVRIGNGSFNSAHQLGVTGNCVVTGNMRIGETPLPSGYTFGVDGKIICTEVMVRLVASWPDYVFAPGYKLRELADLEHYIQTNNHLPGIPAAAEMEKNGLTLGEMQKLQMEKIEELTLYVIQLKKEIKALEEKLQDRR